MNLKIQYSFSTSRDPRDGPPIVCLAPKGALRLGMVTTCVPKARDGHHVSVLWAQTWGPDSGITNSGSTDLTLT